MKRLVLYVVVYIVLHQRLLAHDISFMVGFVLGLAVAATAGYGLAVRTNGKQMVSTGTHRLLTGRF